MILTLFIGITALLTPHIPQIQVKQPLAEAISVPVAIASTTEPKPLIEQYKDLIRAKDWDADIAIGIMICESQGNASVRNYNPNTGDDSYGLFQINTLGKLKSSRPSPEMLKDAETNIDYAYSLYQKRQWKDWRNCYAKVVQS